MTTETMVEVPVVTVVVVHKGATRGQTEEKDTKEIEATEVMVTQEQ